ncbi:hypothetical protein DWX02_13580 [Parabacteroides distasonis]|jgi:hypothetical protein|uniref:hypothetical protein n=1 Tax=Parabacteroides distasonis TaxID=823 RepID=UPI000EFD4A19|nr:hypothetical protein [Parabacteroides distasonis]RGT93948.1 hypothetical protein DWX02_13580 [Parabacteroides distasonis]
METIGQARLLASNKVVDRVKEDLIKTWPRSALLGCAADGFNEGVTYERQKAIEAHWKSCPNLSKDNDRMCNHSFDCTQNCEYMRSFIRLLEE